MLCDATDKRCEQIVIFSNDSDLSPAIDIVKKRHPEMKIGVVTPIRYKSSNIDRNPSAELRKHTDWLRHGIKDNELEKCQLPDKVRSRKRIIEKPEYWK